VQVVTRLRDKRGQSGLCMEALYGWLGMTRQGFFQAAARQAAEAAMMGQVEAMAAAYRREKDRRAGSRSLFYNLGIKELYGIGVTKFERLMSSYGLTLAPLRVRVVTTKSDKQSWNYDNLLSGLVLDDINQAVAGDLTYIYIGSSLFYLFSLMDLYSSRIVGMWASDRQQAIDAKQALDAWAELRGPGSLAGCIHHTDGGSQYFSGMYLDAVSGLGALTSVAENCLENGYAEQLNGLVKNHFIPTVSAQELGRLRTDIARIQHFHDFERKQEGLGWRTPVEYEAYVAGLPEDQRPKKKLYDFGAGLQAA
jgi:transposase InsO family protein